VNHPKPQATLPRIAEGRRFAPGSALLPAIATAGPIRGLLGLDEATSVSSAAAHCPADVAVFSADLGMKMLDVHGMTETTGAFIANMPAEFRLGTEGQPVAGMEVTIADDREILPRVYGGSLAELAAGPLVLAEAASGVADDDERLVSRCGDA
jgi:long-chain acyl-CoA synthetase